MKARLFLLVLMGMLFSSPDYACTGITLTAQDGSIVLARTIEWAGSNIHSRYCIVPRGYEEQSYIPGGVKSGMKFKARYGYVAMGVEQDEFVTEGLNEMGLSAGLFYFPRYGEYEDYNPELKSTSIGDLQLVAWLLGNFKTVDEAIEGIKKVHVIQIDERSSTAHWRIADATGRQIVLEIVGKKLMFHENKLGVLTNSPDFRWQITNLNNYMNLHPGSANNRDFGGVELSPFGSGSGLLGLPGDVTPPSRFVRAAFYKVTARQMPTASETVRQCFQILNNFDIPIGIQYSEDQEPADIPSATQWTAVTDVTNKKIYYRSMYNSAIRCFDLKKIDFARVKYQVEPLDIVTEQPIFEITP